MIKFHPQNVPSRDLGVRQRTTWMDITSTSSDVCRGGKSRTTSQESHSTRHCAQPKMSSLMDMWFNSSADHKLNLGVISTWFCLVMQGATP